MLFEAVQSPKLKLVCSFAEVFCEFLHFSVVLQPRLIFCLYLCVCSATLQDSNGGRDSEVL